MTSNNGPRARLAPAPLLWLLSLWSPPLLLLLLASRADPALAREDSDALIRNILKYDKCVIQATVSSLYPSSYVPTNLAELRQSCQLQAEAFKCVREKTKGGHPLLRRGLMAYVQNRQRFHKKVCSNPSSEVSKGFAEAGKCIMEKRFSQFFASDLKLREQLVKIARKNYNDSAAELRQFCCALWNARRDNLDAIGKECEKHRSITVELINSVAPNEMELVCEEEDKLAKMCPSLEPIKLDSTASSGGPLANSSAAALGLYLMATLGEPHQTAPGGA